ncbi:IS1634 family transposase [Mycoplasmopsis mucosicanis]|uniref:IS1634 family transposase n=1 Tax=Mycoplasmopsis mucosicanis TaxID=458208 RepID=A0A507SJ59_9BACT|nr:IS1634 family transposase [Mycoplasmopsis mucosicanis]TQC51251.1 IS1634 family transposase [Mycoplasmopsis mucosicanis]
MKNYVVMNNSNGKATYCQVVVGQGFKKAYKRIASLGNIQKLTEINENYLEIFRDKVKELGHIEDSNKLKKILLDYLNSLAEQTYTTNIGINILYYVIDKLQIFESLEKSKHKDLENILKYQISSRILQNSSIINSFENKDKFENEVDTKKDTFYGLLDVLVNNEDNLISNLYEKISSISNRNKQFVFFDSTTVYFETFSRDGLRMPGYSKDGKFKEDQVVVGMATDSNGIPIYLKVFRGNTADGNTLIPFIVDLREKFAIKSMTVIADKGMSTNKNIRFLESHGIDYIFAQRLKTTSKSFKEFVLDPSGFNESVDNFKWKELEFKSLWKGGRFNDNFRRRIVIYSQKRANKDKNDRQILIDNFRKKQNKQGVVNAEDIIGTKKYKFFKKVGKMSFTLDLDKIEEDEKFDGYFVYETSRKDLKPEEIVSVYHKQYQIEENFRTLKSSLKVRPIFVRTERHIRGHFLLNFIALIVLKFTIFKINEFYHQQGVIEKLTNTKLIDFLKDCNKLTKLRNGKIIEERFIDPAINKSNEETYNEFLEIVKNCI